MLNNEEIKKLLFKQAQGEFESVFDLESELKRLKEKVENDSKQNNLNIAENEQTLENDENSAENNQENNEIKEVIENDDAPTDSYDKNEVDTQKLDCEGFDKDGFNEQGFDREGFDREGFDKDGFNEQGFDREGFDKEGRDNKGFNRNGIDKDGYDKLGFDKDGYNREGRDTKGFDKQGYNKGGFDKDGFDREGYNWQGINKEGFDKNGFDLFGYDKDGFNEKGFNRQGFDRNGYNWDGYDKDGYNSEGFDKDGFKKSEVDEEENELDLLEKAEKENEDIFVPENLIIPDISTEKVSPKNIDFIIEDIDFIDETISLNPINEAIKKQIRINFDNGNYVNLIKENKNSKNINVDLDFTEDDYRYKTTVSIDKEGNLIDIIDASIYSKNITVCYNYSSPEFFKYIREESTKKSKNKQDILSTISVSKTKNKLECIQKTENSLQKKLVVTTDNKGYKIIRKFKSTVFSEKIKQNVEGLVCQNIYTELSPDNKPQKTNEIIYQIFNGRQYVLNKKSEFFNEDLSKTHEYFEAFNIKELPEAYKNENLGVLLEACPKQSSSYTEYKDGSNSYSCIYAKINYPDNTISITSYTKDADGLEQWNKNYSTILISDKTGSLEVIQNKSSEQTVEKYQKIAGKNICLYKEINGVIYTDYENTNEYISVTNYIYYSDNKTIKSKNIITYKNNSETIIEQINFDENNNITLEEKYIKPAISLEDDNDKIYLYRKLYVYDKNNLSKSLIKEYTQNGLLKTYISKDFNSRTNELVGSTIKEFNENGQVLKITQTGSQFLKNTKQALCIKTFSPEGKNISTHIEKYPVSFSKDNIGELYLDINLSNVFITDDITFDTDSGKIITKTLIKNTNTEFAQILYTQTEVNHPGQGITTDFEQYDEYGNQLKFGENIFQDPRGFVTWDNFAVFGARLRTYAYKIDVNGNIINNTRIPLDEYKGEYENSYSTLIEEMPNDRGMLRKTSQQLLNNENSELEYTVEEELYFNEPNTYKETKKMNISRSDENENIYTDPIRTILTDGGEYIWKKEIINPKYNFSLISFLKKDDSSQKMFINENNLLITEKRTYTNKNIYEDEKIIMPVYSFVDTDNKLQFSQSLYEEKELFSDGELLSKQTKEVQSDGTINYLNKTFENGNLIKQISSITDNTSVRVFEQNTEYFKKYTFTDGEKYFLAKEIKVCVSNEEIITITKEYDYSGYIENPQKAFSELKEINNIPQTLFTKYFDENNAEINYKERTCTYNYNNIKCVDDYKNCEYKFLSPIIRDIQTPKLELDCFKNNIIADCWFLYKIAQNNSVYIQDMIKYNDKNSYNFVFAGTYNNLFELFIEAEGKSIPINISLEELNSNKYNNNLLYTDSLEEKFLQIAYMKLIGEEQAKLYGKGINGLNLLQYDDSYINIGANNIEDIKEILKFSDTSIKIRNPIFLADNIIDEENEIIITRSDNSVLRLPKSCLYRLFYEKDKFMLSAPWAKIENETITEADIKNIANIIVNSEDI